MQRNFSMGLVNMKMITNALAYAVAVFCAYLLARFAVYTGSRTGVNFVLPLVAFCAVAVAAALMAGRFGLAKWLDKPRWWHVAALGMALRLAWAFAIQPQPASDYLYYLNEIRQMLATGEYPYESNYPAAMVYYGALLKMVDSQVMVWVANTLQAGLQIGCIWLITLRLTQQRRAAVLAALSWAVYPAMVTFTSVMSSESPTITLMLAVTAGLLEVLRRPLGQARFVFAGVGLGLLFGAAFYCRNTALLFIPPLGLLLLLRRDTPPAQPKLVLAACLVFGFGLTLVPQALWHMEHYGTPNFTTNPQGGLVFWYGTSRESNGRWNKDWQNGMIAEVAKDGYIWPDYGAKKEASRRAKSRAINNILQDPMDFLGFALTSKFDQMWANDNLLASTWEASEKVKGRYDKIYAALSALFNVGYVTLWLFALAGCAYCIAQGVGGLAFVHLFVLIFFGFHLFFEVQPRYHLLLMPFVCMLSGSGLAFLLGASTRAKAGAPGDSGGGPERA